MKCRKAEKLIRRSIDGSLSDREKKELQNHTDSCPACRESREEYAGLFDVLKTMESPGPKPYFWQRLQPRLKERQALNPWSIWKRWGIRAVSLSLLVLILVLLFTLFVPEGQDKLQPSEALLLQNTNPFHKASNLLDQDKTEDKNMMLIFASLDEEDGAGRYFP